VTVLGAGGTSRDLLMSHNMERARKGTKMKPGQDPLESRFGALHFSDMSSYRNEHNRKG